jgi:ABC-2 type transport system ATP-binding protein
MLRSFGQKGFGAPVIRVEGLEKRYGKFQALHPLDLEVRPGEVFGFLGPNGAGKTTTIRLLSGVLPPTAGRIWIDGVDLAQEPEKARSRIGFIPDRPYLYEKLTAFEFLEFIAGAFGVHDDVLHGEGTALLESHGLLPFADQLIEGYSHGMKQRLVLCATLLHHPRVFIVDEPMVGLDPMGSRQIKKVFRDVAAEGRTVFLSTHSLDVAQEVSDRIGIIHKGRLVALGTLTELRSSLAPGGDLEEVFLRVVEEERAAEVAK